MNNTQKIRDISERNVRLLTLKPERGHLTGATRARIQDGLRCEISEGTWTLATDMPAKAGGEDSAPTPGMLGRGALASCLAIGITHHPNRGRVRVREAVALHHPDRVRGAIEQIAIGALEPHVASHETMLGVDQTALDHDHATATFSIQTPSWSSTASTRTRTLSSPDVGRFLPT